MAWYYRYDGNLGFGLRLQKGNTEYYRGKSKRASVAQGQVELVVSYSVAAVVAAAKSALYR
ncbi:MAG: hypothetical protein ACLR2G_04390 [Phascolarctobacterium faecium]